MCCCLFNQYITSLHSASVDEISVTLLIVHLTLPVSPIIKHSCYIIFYTYNNSYMHALTYSGMTVKAQIVYCIR